LVPNYFVVIAAAVVTSASSQPLLFEAKKEGNRGGCPQKLGLV
jgi:hypothetical protein